MEKQTILAVDDEPANLRMLERLFHKEYRVLLADSGEEALKILGQESVALIITDQQMPGMKGTQLLRESLQTQPDATKIILTGYADIEALIEAVNSTRSTIHQQTVGTRPTNGDREGRPARAQQTSGREAIDSRSRRVISV